LIIDDRADIRDALRSSLEAEGLVVPGTAATGAEGVALALDLKPDCVLVDVDLGNESGLDVANQLTAAGVLAGVILISAYREYSELAVETAAAGFLSKTDICRAAIERLIQPPSAEL
jgi:DNA-binding NarL/FixJ family response regulator